jgi:hypothetical protein
MCKCVNVYMYKCCLGSRRRARAGSCGGGAQAGCRSPALVAWRAHTLCADPQRLPLYAGWTGLYCRLDRAAFGVHHPSALHLTRGSWLPGDPPDGPPLATLEHKPHSLFSRHLVRFGVEGAAPDTHCTARRPARARTRAPHLGRGVAPAAMPLCALCAYRRRPGTPCPPAAAPPGHEKRKARCGRAKNRK